VHDTPSDTSANGILDGTLKQFLCRGRGLTRNGGIDHALLHRARGGTSHASVEQEISHHGLHYAGAEQRRCRRRESARRFGHTKRLVHGGIVIEALPSGVLIGRDETLDEIDGSTPGGATQRTAHDGPHGTPDSGPRRAAAQSAQRHGTQGGCAVPQPVAHATHERALRLCLDIGVIEPAPGDQLPGFLPRPGDPAEQ
jgi:hypothetical protein